VTKGIAVNERRVTKYSSKGKNQNSLIENLGCEDRMDFKPL